MSPSPQLPHSQRYLPDLLLLSAALVWGFTFSIVKDSLAFTTPLMFLLLRFSLALLIITPAVIWRNRSHQTDDDTMLSFTRGEWIGGILTGISMFIGFTFQTWGLVFTSASRSAFITGLSVLLVPFILWGLNQQTISTKRWITVILAAIGLYFLIDPSVGGGLNRGDLFTVVCAIAFAVQIILLAIYAPTLDTLRYFWVQLFTIVVFSAIFGFATGQIRMTPAAPLWWGLAITGVIGTAGAVLGMTWAQKYVSPTRTGLYLAMEPVFGAIYAVMIAGESLSTVSWFGGLLIVAVIIWSEIGEGSSSTPGVGSQTA